MLYCATGYCASARPIAGGAADAAGRFARRMPGDTPDR